MNNRNMCSKLLHMLRLVLPALAIFHYRFIDFGSPLGFSNLVIIDNLKI